MKFVLSLVFSRMRREKARLAFVLTAIAASSCLIVWTIGGFQALFIDATTADAEYLGRYDLKIAAKNADSENARRGGGSFGGPFALGDSSEEKAGKDAKSKPPQLGAKKGVKRGGKSSVFAFSPEFVAELSGDSDVVFCDATTPIRAFVYSPGTERSILEDADAVDEGDKPTLKRTFEAFEDDADGENLALGVDPELRRRAFAAFRATMGTPTGLGSTFWATTAAEPPFELTQGRWLAGPDSTAREAVLTERGAERLGAKPGDDLFLIVKTEKPDKSGNPGATTEYQLKIVGTVDDPLSDGFYVSTTLAQEIAGTPPVPNALFLKLRPDVDVDAFRSRWAERLAAENPNAEAVTTAEIAARKTAEFKQAQSFKYQAASGTLLAALASIFIVFTALNTSVDAQKRLIAFYRTAGLTRGAVALSVFLEAAILAIPGWLGGVATGWLLVFVCSGKTTGLNWETVGFSFLCAVVGAILAALYPTFKSVRVRPLDAIGAPEKTFLDAKRRRRQTLRFLVLATFGLAAIGADVYLVQASTLETTRRAAIHSVVGVLLLALGVVAIIPAAIRVAEAILLPILAVIFRFDPRLMRSELSGNAGRVVAVAVALSVGGGLFVSTQIWGYSMLEPFLPNRSTPEVFAAFLPNGLRPELVDELQKLPEIEKNRFLPVAVEQAAFEADSIPNANPKKAAFANVVFFGVDVEKAFYPYPGDGDKTPLLSLRFRKGDPEKAFAAMRAGRGVIVTDSLTVDYDLGLGDVLKVVHPREPSKILEYPIVGVVYYPGWQWISKTGGVRRNFGRSGGVVFANERTIIADYQLDRPAYFWFDVDGSRSYRETEAACDRLALENLRRDQADGNGVETASNRSAQTAYVKLSTRESLTDSISRRADSVIWGLSKTPLTTLIIASIAVVGAIANSVRARRWQFGAMRAVGLTRGALVRMILVEAILIATVAATTSFVFGFLAAQGALKLGRGMFGTVDPPLILPLKGLAIGFATTFALCSVAALYPAIKTAREEPIRLLKSGRTPD